MFVLYNRTNRARTIARELHVPRYYPYEGKLRIPPNPQAMTHLVNWGCAQLTVEDGIPILNANTRVAASKIKTYTALEKAGVACPAWTRIDDIAQSWNTPFLGRRDGLSGGRGITVYHAGEEPRQHQFYTQVVDCRREFRIHVFNSKVIAIQKKLLKDATSIIHNHTNGVIFQHYDREELNIGGRTTAALLQLALDAVSVVGIDFGAVDIIQERDTNNLFVLEVNTAPGIRTDHIYAAYLEAFRPYVIKG